jgi:hypothetical protein
MVCLQSNSSQVASADVLGEEILSIPARMGANPCALYRAKRQQIEWLKKRNAAPSTDEKCNLRETRIEALAESICDVNPP